MSIYRMPAAFSRARDLKQYLADGLTAVPRPARVIFVMERLIDLAARDFGFDRVALRRRNLVTEKELPYKNPFGVKYDNGDYIGGMDIALRLGDWAGFKRRRASRQKKRSKYRGISVSNYVDISTGVPRESRRSRSSPTARSNSSSASYRRVRGTRPASRNWSANGSACRSDACALLPATPIASCSAAARVRPRHAARLDRDQKSSDNVIEKGLRIAEHLLETASADIEFKNGRFAVKGTNHAVGIFEVARAAAERADLPDDLRGPLYAACDETVLDASYPYGAHVCEVEVDADTGKVTLINYVAVDDVGRAVNPLIIHGQVHGGIAQGVGLQALLEHAHYDPESGQMLAGSFMDYAMPRATDLVNYITEISEVPSSTHPLGIRPAGEGGTVPALAVTINAVVDVQSGLGVLPHRNAGDAGAGVEGDPGRPRQRQRRTH